MKFLNLILLFAFIRFVYANSESELEQPTKLLGGSLKRPDKCSYKVTSNSRIIINYRSRVWGKDEFYENTFLSKPIEYKLGRDKIMKGIDQGIRGMCKGEIRRLLIPANLAFGEVGLPNVVPENTAIVVEVEILEIDSPTRNPWFWAGLIILVILFVLQNRQTRLEQTSISVTFLKEKR